MQVTIISDTIQAFDGRVYYRCGHYFQHKGKRLHRAVAERKFGPIPRGCHVHHIDGNKANNQPENIDILVAGEHLSKHLKERPDSMRQAFIAAGREKAAEWHGSEAGKAWHKEQYAKHCAPALSKRVEASCAHCGSSFMASLNGGKFCSNNCKSASRLASGVDNETRRCAYCGVDFVVNKYQKTRCCSSSCGGKLRFAVGA